MAMVVWGKLIDEPKATGGLTRASSLRISNELSESGTASLSTMRSHLKSFAKILKLEKANSGNQGCRSSAMDDRAAQTTGFAWKTISAVTIKKELAVPAIVGIRTR